MTNEELAVMIQQGKKDLIPALWEQIERFIYWGAFRYYNRLNESCDSAGVTPDDLKQEGYFALLDALQAWTLESGFSFVSFLKYPLKNHFNTLCGLRTVKAKNSPLNKSISFETPLGDDFTIGDTLQNNTDHYKDIDHCLYVEQLHEALDSAMTQLSPRQEQIVKGIYYQDNTLKQLGEAVGVSTTSIYQAKVSAFRKLQRSKYLVSYRVDIIERYSYRGTLSAFKHTGMSSTERAVEALEWAERNSNLL